LNHTLPSILLNNKGQASEPGPPCNPSLKAFLKTRFIIAHPAEVVNKSDGMMVRPERGEKNSDPGNISLIYSLILEN
jgi:hypothetical protein